MAIENIDYSINWDGWVPVKNFEIVCIVLLPENKITRITKILLWVYHVFNIFITNIIGEGDHNYNHNTFRE